MNDNILAKKCIYVSKCRLFVFQSVSSDFAVSNQILIRKKDTFISGFDVTKIICVCRLFCSIKTYIKLWYKVGVRSVVNFKALKILCFYHLFAKFRHKIINKRDFIIDQQIAHLVHYSECLSNYPSLL